MVRAIFFKWHGKDQDMALTLGTRYAIPVLIGHGLTEHQARTKLAEAARDGHTLAIVNGTVVVPITYANRKFTIGVPNG